MGLFAAVCAVYLPVLGFDFVNFDDDAYVYRNPFLKNGLTTEAMRWAFTSVSYFYWQPLTWLSHMTDIGIFGMKPGPMHFENVALHGFTSILLFWVLQGATGSRWRSAAAAAVFALHPLRVESVAWVAERKDVLAGFFWLLSVWAYVRYAGRPTAKRYVLLLAAMAAGAMAKPSIVTLPFALLILDWWPLRRVESWQTRVLEKLPLFAVSIASSVVTFLGQREMGATALMGQVPMPVRLLNAVVSYAWYVVQFVWPHDLAILYPYRLDIPAGTVVASGLLLLLITGAVFWRRREQPYLLAGWLWFVGTLVPVIGLVQAGTQSRADRFSYIPSIGLSVAFVWAAAQATQRWSHRARTAVAVTVLVLLAGASRAQTVYWQDGIAAFSRALAVTRNNAVAEHNLGFALAQRGRIAEAIPHYREGLKLNPKHSEGHYNLGRALWSLGQAAEARAQFAEAIALRPDYAEAHYAMATLLLRSGDPAAAEPHFDKALKLGLEPEYAAQAHNDWGVLLARRNDFVQAEQHFRAALKVNPSDQMAQKNLSGALAAQGR